MFKKPLAVAGLFLFLPACGAGERADFLILEDPASLEILSRFEQPLTPGEKKEILPFAPLKIIEEKTVLGDGITSATEVSYEGRAYYLLGGGGVANPPAMRRYRKCQSQDGEEKLAGADIRCSRGAAPGGRSATIRAGDALQAVFTYETQSYVKKTGAKAEYLWCPASGPFVAKEKDPAIVESGLGQGLQSLLGTRLESANATYASYTQAFNQLTGDSRQPPRWDFSFPRGGMHCRLEGDLPSDALAKSTAVLVHELRNSLTGKPFDVTSEKGEIKISPRAGKSPRQP